jgi:hypothetical protein
MQKYLLDQKAERRRNEFVTICGERRQFWPSAAREKDLTS